VIGSRTLYDIQRQNRADRNDPDWKRRYNRRAGIEGTIFQGVRGFELRQCRHTGLTRTRVQHILTACAMNATRITGWHEDNNHPKPAQPATRFKKPCAQRPESAEITAS
jgi:hypothetical protein